MAAPVIKQIQGTLAGILVILVGSPIGGLAFISISGELKTWSDIPKGLEHGLLLGVGLAAGWIFFKSPLSPLFQSYIGSMKQTSVDAEGTTVNKETRVEISTPAPPKE